MNVEPRFKAPKVKRSKGRARPNEPLADVCEFGIVGVCTGRPSERHHKLRRSQGGSDDASNTADICSACHNACHANPAEAYRNGWMIRGVGS